MRSGELISLDEWLAIRPAPAPPDALARLSVHRLRAGLGLGLGATLLPRLSELAAGGDKQAAAALGVYLLGKGEYSAAAPQIEVGLGDSAELGDQVMLAHALCRAGRPAEAEARLAKLEATSDVLLGLANAALPDAGRYLAAVNKIYARAGLSELSLKSNGGPFRFGQLTATAPPVEDGENRVSVLMPAYNAERYLPVALESLLAQSWRNLEIIVVDDCSTDATAMVAESFARRYHRIRVVRHEVNRGAYPARNTALQHATGRFISVNDADDWSHPQRIEKQVVHALRSGAPIAASSAVRVLEDMSINFRAPQRTYLMSNFASFMLDRQTALDLGGWDAVRMGADAELYSRFATLFSAKRSDALPDVPLSFCLSSSQSLTGQSATGLESGGYGARRQYIEAYRYWHASIAGAPLDRFRLDPERRPFPAPRIFFQRNSHVEVDDLFVFDFVTSNLADLIHSVRDATLTGRVVGVMHWPRITLTMSNVMNAEVKEAIASLKLPVIVPGERVSADRVIFDDEGLLRAKPDRLAEVFAREFCFRKAVEAVEA